MPQVIQATVRLFCIHSHCERHVDVAIKHACGVEDIEAEAKELAEQALGWRGGEYCPLHSHIEYDRKDDPSFYDFD